MKLTNNLRTYKSISYVLFLASVVLLNGCTGRSGNDFFKDSPEVKVAVKDKSYAQQVKIDFPRELGRFDYQSSSKPVLKLVGDEKYRILNRYGEGVKPVSTFKGVKVAVINPQGEVIDIGNPMPFVDPLTYIPIVGELYEMIVHLVIFHIPTWVVGGGETVIPANHYFLAMKKSEFSKSKIKKGDKIIIVHDDVPLDFKTAHSCKLNDGSTDDYLISFVADNIGANTSNYKGKLFLTKDNNQAQDLAKIQILEKELNGTKNANGDLVFSGNGIFGYNRQYSLTLHKSANFLMPYEKITVKGLNCANDLSQTFTQTEYLTNKTLFFANENLDFVKDAKQVAANKKDHDGKVLAAIERKKEEQRQIALAFKAKQEALQRIGDFYKTYTVKVVGKSSGSLKVSGNTHRFVKYLEGTSAYACRDRHYDVIVTPKAGAKIYNNATLKFSLSSSNLNEQNSNTVNISNFNSKKNVSFNCVTEYKAEQGRTSILSNGGLGNGGSYYEAGRLSLSYDVIQVD